MDATLLNKVRKSLIKHEGYSNFPYKDSLGQTTIGIGYNLSSRGLPDEWINTQFVEDVVFFYDSMIRDYSWFKDLNPDRQIVLCDMAFMGYKKFQAFALMLNALSQGNYKQAAMEMLDSQWAIQVGNRAKDLANGMLTGVYDV